MKRPRMLRIVFDDGTLYCLRPEIAAVFVDRAGVPLCTDQMLRWSAGERAIDFAALEAAGRA